MSNNPNQKIIETGDLKPFLGQTILVDLLDGNEMIFSNYDDQDSGTIAICDAKLIVEEVLNFVGSSMPGTELQQLYIDLFENMTYQGEYRVHSLSSGVLSDSIPGQPTIYPSIHTQLYAGRQVSLKFNLLNENYGTKFFESL
jgi:hypothetical protein